jgi:hypothetical protein
VVWPDVTIAGRLVVTRLVVVVESGLLVPVHATCSLSVISVSVISVSVTSVSGVSAPAQGESRIVGSSVSGLSAVTAIPSPPGRVGAKPWMTGQRFVALLHMEACVWVGSPC